jgi:hypothetical protein
VLVVEISVNGEHKATCGAADLRQLVARLAVNPRDNALSVECMGVRSIDASTDEVLKWVSARIQVGDEVSFRVAQSDSAQVPIDSQKIAASGRGRDA